MHESIILMQCLEWNKLVVSKETKQVEREDYSKGYNKVLMKILKITAMRYIDIEVKVNLGELEIFKGRRKENE